MILMELEETYEKLAFPEIYEEWRRRSITLGRQVRITSLEGDLTGEAADLGEDGALLLRTGEGPKRVLAGDCVHLRSLEDS